MTSRMYSAGRLSGSGVADEVGIRLPEEARLLRPSTPVGVGVLALLGSSGRMDVERARFFASHGAHGMALRWFGGVDQAPGICEIPLEVFVRALDRLSEEPVDTLAVVGLSKGAEAALLLACVDRRVGLTVAISPPSVVWANVGPGPDGQVTPYRSSWTWRGEPLPFVPYDDDWEPPETAGPVAYSTLYRRSLARDAAVAEAAAIPIEEAEGDLVLVAGRGDRLWPSAESAQALAERRVKGGKQVEVILNDQAGHSPLWPGQPVPEPSTTLDRGGSPEADAELGSAAWAATAERLGLG
ncbi:MAG: uncharacterized protein QOK30_660 [Nocardioidaceae bacterium]|nr:uncharacterized protein [Nocardioidaceae bacterium]